MHVLTATAGQLNSVHDLGRGLNFCAVAAIAMSHNLYDMIDEVNVMTSTLYTAYIACK